MGVSANEKMCNKNTFLYFLKGGKRSFLKKGRIIRHINRNVVSLKLYYYFI